MKTRTTTGSVGVLCAFLAPLAFGSDRFPIYWIGPEGEGFSGVAGDVNRDGMGDLVLVSGASPSPTSPQQAFVRSGLNGSLLHAWTPSPPTGWAFGASHKPAGDLNLDGFDDVVLSVAVGAPSGPAASVLEVRSGLDGSVTAIISPLPVSNGTSLASNTVGLGDADGDGWPELLVMGNHQVFVPGCMSYGRGVYNLEAPGFALQYYQTSWECAQEFGSQIGRLDDVDGDGRPDFYVGAPRTDAGGIYDAGWIGVFSGATGSLITSLSGTTTNQYLGGGVAALRDFTNDGLPEMAVLEDSLQASLSRVRVLSLPSFATLYTLTTASTGSFSLGSLESLGDADGDGFDDILVHRITPQGHKTLTAFSGPSGAVIGEVSQGFAGSLMNPWGALGDVNGDGLGDFAVTPGGISLPGPGALQTLWGGWQWPVTGGGLPTVHVARNLDLVGTAVVGGTARFQVVAPKRAGRPFQIALSRDAAFPGVALGPFLFPLVPDELFWASAALGIGGSLTATGHGTVSIPIPPDPTLRDVTLHASGVVYDPGGPLGIGCVLTRTTFAIQ